jgi:site-specific DNA-adenine methylase
MRKQPPRIFPYYGSKARIAKHYPEPRYDAIVEPFAGAAAYSQRHWDTPKVVLFDTDDRVVAAWQFIINATEADVLTLPDVAYGESPWEFGLSKGEACLIELHCLDAFATRNRRMGKRELWNRSKKRVASLVHRFSHWQCRQASFADIGNAEVTWFVDPPYQFGGEHYHCGTQGFDFDTVAAFAKTRKGQVIVCENTKADWLPFKPLVDIKGTTNKKSTEAIWTND